MSRRKRRGPPTCNQCGAPITFKLSPITGKLRPFDPTPVDGRDHPVGVTAYPVEGHRAWRFEAFVEELMARHEQSRADAIDEAYDHLWFTPHTCAASPKGDTQP